MSFGKNHSDSNNNSAFNQTQNFTGTDNTTGTTNFSQNGTTSATSTPTNAPWVTDLGGVLGGGVSALTGQDPRSFVAGADPLQTHAAAGAGGLTGSPWNFDAAANLDRSAAYNPLAGQATGMTTNSADGSWAAPIMGATAPSVTGGKGYDYVSKYMDPATNDVVNATLADFDHSAGQTRAQQALSLAGSGAFGGSGAALTQAATEDSLARARATTDSGLRTAAFTQALGAANSDADRATQARIATANNVLSQEGIKSSLGLGEQQQQLAAGGQLGALGAQQQAGQLAAGNALNDTSSQFDANQRANITTQAQLGDAMRQIQQQYAQSPIDYQNALNQLFSSLPLSLFHGQTDVGTTNQTGTQDQNTTENQSGTTNGSGTSSGSGSTTGFGFKIGK